VIVTTVYVRPDGPYIVTGEFVLVAHAAPRDGASVVLCRCGRSLNKPYCDGTHTRVGFADSGIVPDHSEPDCPHSSGRLRISPMQNGPLKFAGHLALSGADGRICHRHDISLCRCGGSATKPFCDGTHDKVGFIA